MDFAKLSKATHTTKAEYGGESFTIQFRSSTQRAYEELARIDGYIDREAGTVKLPEYLSVFVVALISGNTTFNPDLDYWKDADLDFVSTVHKAISEAFLNDSQSKKSTAASSDDTLKAKAETSAA